MNESPLVRLFIAALIAVLTPISHDACADRDNRPNQHSQRERESLNSRLYDDRSKYSGYDRRSPRPVNDVIREVQDRYGGQVIGVQHNDGETYRVRVLQRDGRVKNVLVPAE